MHIAINAQLLSVEQSYRGAGVSVYSRNLLETLSRVAKSGGTQHRFSAFTHIPNLSTSSLEHGLDLGGVSVISTGLPLHKPTPRIAWEQTLFPLKLKSIQADLVHGLVNVLPLQTNIPSVVTVHDLSFLRMPEVLPRLKRAYLTKLCAASVARASHIIAVSRQTAMDLMQYFQVDARKISVVYNGVDASFRPASGDGAQRFRQEHNLPERFLLHVGTLEPRKNLVLLIHAFARWRVKAQPADRAIKLILAGSQGWFYQQIFAEVQKLGLEKSVQFIGHVPQEELPHLYQAAEAFVYPSLLEGFGLPVLEAMACGTPVLCSRAGSLLEVSAGAAVTVPAQSLEGLTAGLALITGQPALRRELSCRGLARAKCFSWQRTARETIAVYDLAAK